MSDFRVSLAERHRTHAARRLDHAAFFERQGLHSLANAATQDAAENMRAAIALEED